MKKVIIILLIIFLNTNYSQSPISNGTYSVGGNISFSSILQNKDSESEIYLSFAPRLGYFFIDNLYTGMSLIYNYRSSNNNNSSTYGIGPFARYYFDVDKIKPFLGFGIDYYYYNYDNLSDGDSQTSINLNGGIDYFITNYFALEAALNYNTTILSYSENNINQFNIAIGAAYFIQ